MKDLKIKVIKNVTEQMIEDQIVTALEGGSNYWYHLGDLSMLPKNKKNDPLAVLISRSVLNEGVVVPVHDIEYENEVLGFISKKSIEKGLTLMAKDYSQDFDDMLNEEGDAGTADIFFQLAVMGEVVFG